MNREQLPPIRLEDDRRGVNASADAGTPGIPPAFRDVLAPWLLAAHGDEDVALDLLHADLKARLRES